MFDILNKYIVKTNDIGEIINDEHIYCTSKMWRKDGMNNDLISRKETKDALIDSLMELLDNMWDYNLFVINEKIKDILNDMPSKRDKLVWNVGIFNNAICPVCCYDSKIRIDLLNWKYCPNCGTRLRKEHYENDSAED